LNTPHAWRYLSVQIFLVLLATAVIGQIIRIQSSEEAKAILDNTSQYSGEYRSYFPARGRIYDRSGYLLAGNRTAYEVGIDIRTVHEAGNANNIALAASMYLGLDYADALDEIQNPDSGLLYLVLASAVDSDIAENLMNLQELAASQPSSESLTGLHFQPTLQRSYPENDLAANILGFVTGDHRGYFGIEEKYNSVLSGVPVLVWIPSDPNRVNEWPEIPAGSDLILTIDREIQAMTEEILDDAMDTYGAESGTIVVMNPQTGEILAMATTLRMDPDNLDSYEDLFPEQTPYNWAISHPYEPGSVMKIYIMAAALDAGVVLPSTTFNDTGSITIGGATFRNWNGGAWGIQDMTGCLQHSLNVCLAWVATQLGVDNMYSYLQDFGFGHQTGVDLAWESPGRLKLPGDEDWHISDLATNSFGQGVTVTPLQMVMAASAIANEGQMVYPHMVYAVVQNGQQRNTETQIVGNPISARTAQTLSEMLVYSLENETSLALVPGYRLAGKTGTAQIPTEYGIYDPNVTNTSFIGWGPVDDPQFMVYVWIEEPSASIWGSEVAAPVFQQVVERLVVLMHIPPDYIRLQAANRGP